MNKKLILILSVVVLVVLFLIKNRQESVQSKVESQPVLPIENTRTASPVSASSDAKVKESSKDDFDGFLESTRLSLPTEAQIRNSPGSKEDTPIEILNASKEFGKIEDEMKKDPRKMPKGIAFFHTCARVENTPNSLRAVCLRKAWDWTKRSGGKLSSDNDIPEDVKRIARFLPES